MRMTMRAGLPIVKARWGDERQPAIPLANSAMLTTPLEDNATSDSGNIWKICKVLKRFLARLEAHEKQQKDAVNS